MDESPDVIWQVRATAGSASASAPIGVEPIVIGTGAHAGVRLDHPDLDPYHVELVPLGEDLLVRDLDSRLGTRLSGPSRLRVLEARAQPPFDLLLGSVHVTIRSVGSPTLGYAAHTPPRDPKLALRVPQDEVDDVVGQLLRGRSLAMWNLRQKIRQYAKTDVNVIIRGETGTGKELVAQALHQAGKDPKSSFIAINCAGIPETLAESELFGHEPGAFSGALKRHDGAFRRAKRGTLFLDEIGEMSNALQAKLLRALESREACSIGSSTPYPIEARVIAATNRDVRRSSSGFRQDLYERFVVELYTPPLRERPEDIPVLVEHLLSEICKRYNRPKPDATPFIEAAKTLRLEGNVRTLRNHLERAIIEELDASSMVDAAAIEEPIAADITPLLDLPWAELQDSVEQLYPRRLIARSGGNVKQMAALAGVNRATIFRWLAKIRKSPLISGK